MTDELTLSYLGALTDAQLKHYKSIVIARNYHDGRQNVELTTRLQEFLGEGFGSVEFRLNLVRSVVTSMSEKLSVDGFDSEDKAKIEWAKATWEANNMDSVQDDVYEAALSESAHYIIVDWPDKNRKYARWIPQQQFTPMEAGGDDSGCFLKYPEDDPHQEPEYGVKYWVEYMEDERGNKVLTQRKTLYYPDKIAKYRRGKRGDWEAYQDEGDEEWPIPWVDSLGDPLGIALIPFYNGQLRPEALDGIPVQDAVNKIMLDLLSTEDMTAYRVFVALGFIPTTDGLELKSDLSNALTIKPGIVIGTTKSKTEADMKAIEPADLKPITDSLQQLIVWMALVTDTPVTRFITTKLVSSDETLKQQEQPLIAKVENRQKLFGLGFKRCFELSLKLSSEYAPEDTPDSEKPLSLVWRSAKSLKDRLEELTLKKGLGVPNEQIWTELGYSQDKITEWANAKEAAMPDITPQTDPNQDGGTETQGVEDGNTEE